MDEKPATDSKLRKFKYTHIKMTSHVLKSIIYKFEEMVRFKDFMFYAIESEKKSIKDFHKKESEGMSDGEREYYYEMVSEDYFLVEDFFTETSLYSFILILYSYLESGLNSLCRIKYSDIAAQHKKDNLKAVEEGRKQKKLNLKRLNKIKENGIINKAKKYLEKFLHVNLEHVENEWNEIDGLRKIRNAIVHRSGYFDGRDIEICEETNRMELKDPAIKRHDKDGRIKINHNGKIIITQEYADFILKQVISFFKKIEV